MDTLIPTSAELAGDPAVISRADKLRPVVEAASDEIEDGRRISAALLDKLHEARLFRLLLPRSIRGDETDPVTFFHVTEAISTLSGVRVLPEALIARLAGKVQDAGNEEEEAPEAGAEQAAQRK